MKGTDREFLVAKGELFATAARGREAGVSFARRLETQWLPAKMSRSVASSIDGDIEMYFAEEQRVGKLADARKQLRDRFGFDRLSTDPNTVVQRVLKRGRIRNEQEMAVVREFVSNQGNEEVIGAESYERLARILDEAES